MGDICISPVQRLCNKKFIFGFYIVQFCIIICKLKKVNKGEFLTLLTITLAFSKTNQY